MSDKFFYHPFGLINPTFLKTGKLDDFEATVQCEAKGSFSMKVFPRGAELKISIIRR